MLMLLEDWYLIVKKIRRFFSHVFEIGKINLKVIEASRKIEILLGMLCRCLAE